MTNKSALTIVGSIFASAGLLLIGIALVVQEAVYSLVKYLSQIGQIESIFSIDLNCSLYFGIPMIVIGVVLIVLALFRKSSNS